MTKQPTKYLRGCANASTNPPRRLILFSHHFLLLFVCLVAQVFLTIPISSASLALLFLTNPPRRRLVGESARGSPNLLFTLRFLSRKEACARGFSFLLSILAFDQHEIEPGGAGSRGRCRERIHAHTTRFAIDREESVPEHVGPLSRCAVGEMAHFLDGKLGRSWRLNNWINPAAMELRGLRTLLTIVCSGWLLYHGLRAGVRASVPTPRPTARFARGIAT